MYLRELFEALPLSTAKSFRQIWDPSQYEDIFQKYPHDKKAFRIYLPLEKVDGKPDYDDRTMNLINKELDKNGYKIQDYIAGYAISNDGKRQIKIGKLLSSNKLVQQLFNNDPVRQLASKDSSNLLVCISRHPYDIAGMSTDRGWNSCMNLADKDSDNGNNSHYILHDVTQGTLVAYLIDKDDKNIQKPKGRFSIKVFINEDNPQDWILVREQRAYGSTAAGFKETVDKWLSEINGDKSEGLYCINPNVYADSAKKTLHLVNKQPADILKILKDNPQKYNIHWDFEYKLRNDGSIDMECKIVSGALLRYLNQYNIKINKLVGDYDCSLSSLTQFPISTPRYIKGDFYCNDNTNLSSITNAPLMISGELNAENTKLDPEKTRKYITAGNYIFGNRDDY
jgi:hypothetical protein